MYFYALMRARGPYPTRIYEPASWQYLVYGSLTKTAGTQYGKHIFLLRLEGELSNCFTTFRDRTHLVPPGKIGVTWPSGWICFHPDAVDMAWYLGEDDRDISIEEALNMVGLPAELATTSPYQ